MNNNHRITLNTNKNIIVEFTNERIIPASGLAVVGALLGKSDFVKKLNRIDVTSNRSQHQIKRDVKRRRLGAVISNLIMMAGHVTMHARQLIIGLGKSNVWRHIFSDICQKYAVTNA